MVYTISLNTGHMFSVLLRHQMQLDDSARTNSNYQPACCLAQESHFHRLITDAHMQVCRHVQTVPTGAKTMTCTPELVQADWRQCFSQLVCCPPTQKGSSWQPHQTKGQLDWSP